MSENEEKPEESKARSANGEANLDKKAPRKRTARTSKKASNTSEKASGSDNKTGSSSKDEKPNAKDVSTESEPVKVVRDVRTSKKSETEQAEAKTEAANSSDDGGSRRNRGRNRSRRSSNKQPDQQQQQYQNPEVDAKLVTKRAWKIFLGEVNEDGVALVDDKTAREIAKRSIKIAEIFTEEEAKKEISFKLQEKKRKPEKSSKEKSKTDSEKTKQDSKHSRKKTKKSDHQKEAKASGEQAPDPSESASNQDKLENVSSEETKGSFAEGSQIKPLVTPETGKNSAAEMVEQDLIEFSGESKADQKPPKEEG